MTRSIAALRRRVLALTAIGATVGAFAVVDVGAAMAANHYPSALTSAFISTCSKTAQSVNKKVGKALADRYCTLAIACIERKLTLSQFEQVVKNMQSGKANPKAKVVTACERSAIQQATQGQGQGQG